MNLNPIIVQIKARAEQYFAVVHRMGTAIKNQAAVIQAHLNKIKAPNLAPKFALSGSTIQSIKQASTWSSFLSKNFSSAYQWAGRLASSIGSGLYSVFSRLGSISSSVFSGMRNMISSMIKSTEKFGTHWINVGKNIRSAGKMMSVYISTPLALLGAGAVKAFADFDQSVTKTKAFLNPKDRTPENMKAMENKSIQMAASGQAPFSATDTMDSFKTMAQTGVSAAASLKLIGDVAEFATAAEMEMGESTENLLTALYAFKAASDDPLIMAHNMKRMSDVIVSAASASSASVGEVVRSMGSDSAAAAHQYGMSIEGLGAALAVFAKAGKKAENAGHTVGRALRLLTGTFTKNEAVWKKYGINLIDETTGQFVDFGTAIGMIEDKMGSLTGPGGTKFLAALGLEQLSQKSITPLLGLAKEMQQLEEEFKRTGTTSERAKIIMGSFANQMKMFKNAVMAAAIAIGRMLSPYVIFVMAKIREGMKWVEGWTQASKDLALKIGIVAAVLGPLVVGLSIFVSLVGYLAIGVVAVVSGFSAFIGSLAVFLPLVVFVGVVIQRILVWFGGFNQIIADVWATMAAFWAWAAPMWNAFASLVITVVIPMVRDLIDVFIMFSIYMVESVTWALNAVVAYFGTSWKEISELTAELFMMMEFAWLNMGMVADLAIAQVKLYFFSLYMDIAHFFGSGGVGIVFSNLGEIIKSTFLNVFNMGTYIFQNLITNIVSLMANLPGLIAGTTDFSKVWTPLTEGFVKHIPDLQKLPERAMSDTEKAMVKDIEGQKEAVAGAYNKFKGDKAAANAIKEQEKAAAEASPPGGIYEGIIKASAHGNEDFIEEIEENTKKGQDALKMSEAALKGSSEALARIMEYRDGRPLGKDIPPPPSAMTAAGMGIGGALGTMIPGMGMLGSTVGSAIGGAAGMLGPTVTGAAGTAFDLLQPTIPTTSSAAPDSASTPQQQMIDLLRGIFETNTLIANKPSIEDNLQPAGIA